MSTLLLKDKVIFLTGGSCGIGRECAKACADEGAKIIVVARDRAGVEAVAAELGPEHLGLVCDVTRNAEVKAAVEKALKHFGRLDAVHNNAGISSPCKPIHDTTDAEWSELFDVNLKGVLHTTRHAFEALVASKGCILNTSSLVGVIGQELHAAYTATKGGLNALTKSMALDYAKYGIRVNAVCPAAVWTPMLRRWCSEQPDPASTVRYLDEIHPLGYCPESTVIADACVFLLSDKARFITGHIMHVSGGAELGYRR
ncbi:MAG TPA: SDR family oxidoreductase [Candidatus Binatia bacterium]|jgi:meso-butanediol dehydrogenase/(S,S)-butanediol dehydrogenase/diacetyl reductase|nr:SDR family oxidoreductase [Candidatus Binatia bacterium]